MKDKPQEFVQTCQVDPARASALAATLGRTECYEAGDALPEFFHQAYFWDAKPPDSLGRDGHPRVGGGVIPETGLSRRMWAGGKLLFHAPFRAGIAARKHSVCETLERKTGRSGPLAIVRLRHEIFQESSLRVTEWQDLVYRADPVANGIMPPPPRAPQDEDVSERVDFSTTMLFRYSALTFNGHRIHYDMPYAQDVEGYAGLVVHGPLLAQCLMLLAVRQLGPLRQFSFRATAPLAHTEQAELCLRSATLWVRGPDGRQCMLANAEPVSE